MLFPWQILVSVARTYSEYVFRKLVRSLTHARWSPVDVFSIARSETFMAYEKRRLSLWMRSVKASYLLHDDIKAFRSLTIAGTRYTRYYSGLMFLYDWENTRTQSVWGTTLWSCAIHCTNEIFVAQSQPSWLYVMLMTCRFCLGPKRSLKIEKCVSRVIFKTLANLASACPHDLMRLQRQSHLAFREATFSQIFITGCICFCTVLYWGLLYCRDLARS